MDELLQNPEALAETFTVYRELIGHYVVSNNPLAIEMRAHMRQHNHGAFLPSLYQDLSDICTYFKKPRDAETWDESAVSDLRGILSCISSFVCTSDASKDQETLAQPPAKQLEGFRKQTSDWNYQQLLNEQLRWLQKHVALKQLTFGQRKRILQRSTTAAQLLHRDSLEHGEDDDTGTRDAWAEKTSNKLCLPLQRVHETLLRGWNCGCRGSQKHSHVLASFATPCQSNDEHVNFLLKFTTENSKQVPWSTVLLNITDDEVPPHELESTNDNCTYQDHGVLNGQDAAVAAPAMCLHDNLVQLSRRCPAIATLSSSAGSESWATFPDLTGNRPEYSMVSLTSLTAEDATHPIREKPYEQRVALALLVAYAFLQLGNGPWFPYTTDSINIWFYQPNDSPPILLQPFLEVCLDTGDSHTENKRGTHSMLRMINPNMQCLPVLGKFMLELISGSPVELSGIEDFMVSYRHQNPERAPYVWGAIKSCFFEPAFKGDVIHGNELLRTKFLEDIIYRLNKLLTQCKSTLEEEITKMPLYPPIRSASSRKRRSSTTADPRLAKRSPLPSIERANDQTTISADSHTRYCLHDDGSRRQHNTDQEGKAQCFIDELQRFHGFLPLERASLPPVRVAILDTGFHIGDRTWMLYDERVKEARSWLGQTPKDIVLPGGNDPDGHGTHCATAFLKCASDSCELFVAQVFDSRPSKDRARATGIDDTDRVAQAISHAVEVWDVDIISMSFGYEAEVEVIEKALKKADDNNVLLIAAASNVGGNTALAQRWPGTRDNVMSVYAAEGKGFQYADNPPPRANAYNFTTLGVMVPVWSVPNDSGISQEMYCTGTSYATPIAAAIAASVLEFIRHTESDYVNQFPKNRRERLQDRVDIAKTAVSRASGMSKVFMLMAEKKGDYDYVQPANLLTTEFVSPVSVLGRFLEALWK